MSTKDNQDEFAAKEYAEKLKGLRALFFALAVSAAIMVWGLVVVFG